MVKSLRKMILGLCISTVLLSSVSVYAANYTPLSFKQKFYYGKVVPYKNYTNGYSTALQNAFSSGITDWNYAQSGFQWGQVTSTPSGCSDNRLNIYYLANTTQQGRNQITYSGSYYVSSWAELNQWALEVQKTTSVQFKRSVAGHEIAHGMSLNDFNTVTTVLMSHDRTRDTLYTPQADDITGVKSVYP